MPRKQNDSFLTAQDINDAIDLVTPSILAGMKSGRFKRKIVAVEVQIEDYAELTVTRWIKLEENLQIDRRFSRIAARKTDLAMRTHQSTGIVVNEFPHLLTKYDPIYRGGVYEAGIAVGVSAFKAYHDHMVALWILDAIVGIAREKFDQLQATGGDFIHECKAALGQ
ncbi:MAG: hypothetical protein WCP93_04190 [Candidatus Berkelbacteria bacterium]